MLLRRKVHSAATRASRARLARGAGSSLRTWDRVEVNRERAATTRPHFYSGPESYFDLVDASYIDAINRAASAAGLPLLASLIA